MLLKFMNRPTLEKRFAAFVSVIGVLLASTGLAESSQSKAETDSLYVETREAMGTEFSIYLYAEHPGTAKSLFEEAFLEIERVEQLLSTYRKTSELSRINRDAADGPVTLDPEMTRLLERLFTWSHQTNHAFDPSVGSLLDLWGFTESRNEIPSSGEIDKALQSVGTDKITLSVPDRLVEFNIDGLSLDAGAFGKGYALDQAARVLNAYGVSRALLESGQSSYLALEAPPDSPGWLISVSDPCNPDSVLSKTVLADGALSTSGGAHRYVELSGERYSHIIDPRSGFPATGSSLSTVIAGNALDSDILSTAVFVLGPEKGIELLRSVPSARGLIVSESSREHEVFFIRWDDS